MEAHSGLALQTTQLLDQTEAADVITVGADGMDTIAVFVCVHVKLMERTMQGNKLRFYLLVIRFKLGMHILN